MFADNTITLIDIIGLTGVTIILVTYLLLQLEKMAPTSLGYSLLNILGSALIMVSLSINWNLASAVIEAFWIMISLIGVYKYFEKRKA
jgi:hypothetical protein